MQVNKLKHRLEALDTKGVAWLVVAALVVYAAWTTYLLRSEPELKSADTSYTSEPVAAPDKQLVYYARLNNLNDVSPLSDTTGKAVPLPDKLIIKPGNYIFSGKEYALDKQGLYRFVDYWKGSEQRFVYDGDMEALLSAISWATVHGLSDVYFHRGNYKRELQSRKLSLACWGVSNLSRILLQENGVKARIVSVFAQAEKNRFSDGHAFVEAFDVATGRWFAYDLDHNVIPTDQGRRLSALEIYDRVAKGQPIEFMPLSGDPLSDASDLKFSEDFSAAFLYDRLASGPKSLRKFYKRVFQSIVIYDGDTKTYPVLDEQIEAPFRSYIAGLSDKYTWLSREQFEKRLYSDK